MGYCMEQEAAVFNIKPSNFAPALAAIKTLKGQETVNDASGAHFRFVDAREFAKASSFPEMMRAWGWDLDLDLNEETGEIERILNIEFMAEKLGDEEKLFNAIAPFVEPDSYIEMLGEDGTAWRWIFDGKTCKTCKEKKATRSFD